MKQILPYTACLLSFGCGGMTGIADPTSGIFISATVDGLPYQGSSQGAVYIGTDGETESELMMFPADEFSGTLIGWEPVVTGTFIMSTEEGSEAIFSYVDGANGQYASTSGEMSIDTWQDHNPDNAADTRLGYMGGSFAGTFTRLSGADTIEITDGSFFVMVTDNTP
jgi:hypothetical protein